MTRALGTALGVAIAALAYDLAGTHGGPSAGLRSVSALFAACLLVAAGWNLRRR
jgi:hypothetical protein